MPARQGVCGFEMGGIAECGSSSGSPAISNAQAFSGTYSLLIDVAAGTGTQWARIGGFSATGAPTNWSLDQAYIEHRIRVETVPGTAEEILEVMNTSDTLKCAVRAKYVSASTFVLQLFAVDGTTQIGSDGTTVLSTNTWYRIGIFASNGTSTKVELRINGTPEITSTTADLGATNVGFIRLGKVANRNSGALKAYYDNVICDSIEWPGDTKLEYRVPDAVGSYDEYTASAGTKVDCVTDIPYDTGDYVYNASATGDQTFTFPDLSGNCTLEICCIQLMARCAENGSSTSAFGLTWVAGGTQYSTTTSDPGTSAVTRGQVQSLNPYYKRHWKKSEADAVECGVINRAAKQVNTYTVGVYTEYRVGATEERPYYAAYSGFENGNNDEFYLDTVATVVTSPVKTGTYSLKCQPSGSGQAFALFGKSDWADLVAFNVPELFIGAHVRVHTAPSASEDLLGVETSGAGNIAKVRIDENRKLSVYDASQTIIGSVGSTVLELDTWYHISFGVHIGSSGAFSLYIDGAGSPELSGTGGFGTTNIGYAGVGKRANRNGSGYEIYFDNAVINLMGHPKKNLEILRGPPTSDGSFTTNWTPSAGSLYQCVDEVPPNTTDQATSSTNGADLTMNFASAATIGVLTPIHSIKCVNVVRGSSTQSQNIIYTNSHFMRSNTGAYSTVNVLRGFIYDRSFGSDGGAPWTTAEIDAIEVGVRNRTANAITVDAIYLEVLFEGTSVTTENLALTISGQSSVAAVMKAWRPLALAVAGQSGFVPSLLRKRTLALTLAGQSDLSAVLAKLKYLAATLAAQSSFSAVLKRSPHLALAVDGQSSLSGSVVRVRKNALAVSAQSGLTALYTRKTPFSLTAAATSSLATALLRKRTLAAAVSSQSSLTAAIQKLKALSAAFSAQSNLAAVLKRSPHLAAAITGQSSLTSVLLRKRTYALSVEGQSGFAAALVRGRRYALALAGQSGLTASYVRVRRNAFAVSGQADVEALLDVLQSTTFYLSIAAQSGMAALLQVKRPMSAAFAAQSSLSGIFLRKRTIAAAMAGQSGFAAILRRSPHLALSIAAQASLVAASRIARKLALSVSAQSGLAAELSLSGLIELALAVSGQSGFTPAMLRRRAFAASVAGQSSFAALLRANRMFAFSVGAQSALSAESRIFRQFALSVAAQSEFTAEWLAEFLETSKDIWHVPRCARVWTAPHSTRVWLVPQCGRVWKTQW